MDAKPARRRKDVNPAARNKAESIFKDDGADDKSAGIEQCRKRIDLSSNVPGASALCFVFCVRHGHCYGFHVVPLEGRRDAFLPIFSHMKTAPKIVYYDFACGKSENCFVFFLTTTLTLFVSGILLLPCTVQGLTRCVMLYLFSEPALLNRLDFFFQYFYNREPQFWENTRPFVDM